MYSLRAHMERANAEKLSAQIEQQHLRESRDFLMASVQRLGDDNGALMQQVRNGWQYSGAKGHSGFRNWGTWGWRGGLASATSSDG